MNLERAGSWDLIVVGAGTAGMACAISAAEAGAIVVVIEKTNQIGGTLHISGGHMSAAGTRRQRERGIEDTPAQHLADIMRISQQTADPIVAGLAVELAPGTADWLEELNFPFDPLTPTLVYGHEPYSQPRTFWGVDSGKSILEVLRPQWDRLVAEGNISVKFEHELAGLILENGRVTGVRLTSNGNRAIEVRGYRTILTTGGYGANPTLFARVTPGHPYLASNAAPTSTGEGIQLATEVGARFHNGEKYMITLGGIELEPGSGRVDWDTAWANISNAVVRPPREIYVNSQGERIMAEDTPNPDPRERALLKQPDHRLWVIMDSVALRSGSPLVSQWSVDEFCRHAGEGKVAWIAASLGELARKAGIDPDGLVQTVLRFNQAVQAGGGDHFGRTDLQYAVSEPPFYALLTRASSLITFGGLAVDGDLQVLDQQNRPIAGLYAAGEILGAGATSGNAFCGGMSVTPALSLGRWLGQRLGSLAATP